MHYESSSFTYQDLKFEDYIEQEFEKFQSEVSKHEERDQKKCVLVFPPLKPRGRFLIHNWLTLSNIALQTVSIGKGCERRTIIFPQNNDIKPQAVEKLRPFQPERVKQSLNFNENKSKCFIGYMEENKQNLRIRSHRRPDRQLYVPRRRKPEDVSSQTKKKDLHRQHKSVSEAQPDPQTEVKLYRDERKTTESIQTPEPKIECKTKDTNNFAAEDVKRTAAKNSYSVKRKGPVLSKDSTANVDFRPFDERSPLKSDRVTCDSETRFDVELKTDIEAENNRRTVKTEEASDCVVNKVSLDDSCCDGQEGIQPNGTFLSDGIAIPQPSEKWKEASFENSVDAIFNNVHSGCPKMDHNVVKASHDSSAETASDDHKHQVLQSDEKTSGIESCIQHFCLTLANNVIRLSLKLLNLRRSQKIAKILENNAIKSKEPLCSISDLPQAMESESVADEITHQSKLEDRVSLIGGAIAVTESGSASLNNDGVDDFVNKPNTCTSSSNKQIGQASSPGENFKRIKEESKLKSSPRKMKIHKKSVKDEKLKRKRSKKVENINKEEDAEKTRLPSHDEDTWDTKWNESGECLNDKTMTELQRLTKIENPKIYHADKPEIDYLSFEPKSFEQNSTEFDNLVEIYDFSPDFKTTDICLVLQSSGLKDFDIKWVDDTHAIAILGNAFLAHQATKISNLTLKTRSLNEGSKQSKLKARSCGEMLLPYKPRPATTASVARNLVTSALGLRSGISKEQRSAERQRIAAAKETKRIHEEKKKEAWGD